MKKKNGGSAIVYGTIIILGLVAVMMALIKYIGINKTINSVENIFDGACLGVTLANKEAFLGTKGVSQQQIIINDCECVDTPGLFNMLRQSYTTEDRYVIASEISGNLIVNGKYIYTQDAVVPTYDKNEMFPPSGKFLNNRDGYKVISESDVRTKALINNIISIIETGINNTPIDNSIDRVGNIMSVGNLNSSTSIQIPDDSQFKDWIEGDISITRLQIYNVFRYTLAKRHVYASPFMVYSVNGVSGYTWDGSSSSPKLNVNSGYSTINTNAVRDMINSTDSNKIGIEILVTGWNGPTNDADFMTYFLNLLNWDVDPSEMDEPITDQPEYKWYYEIWKRDLEAWNNRNTRALIVWEDTGVTNNCDWFDNSNGLNRKYGFLWANNEHTAIKITNDILQKKESKKNNVKLLPIAGYSVYMYTRGEPTIKTGYNNWIKSISSTKVYGDKNDVFIPSINTLPIKIGDYNKSVTNNNDIIEDTSTNSDMQNHMILDTQTDSIGDTAIYVEIQYKLIMFKEFVSYLDAVEGSMSKTIRASRVVKLKINE
jgi:hypothetical protein